MNGAVQVDGDFMETLTRSFHAAPRSHVFDSVSLLCSSARAVSAGFRVFPLGNTPVFRATQGHNSTLYSKCGIREFEA